MKHHIVNISVMKGKNKIDDCPLAPVGNYLQGFPDEEGHPVRTVLYVPPCKDWDGEMCHWFDPPQRVSELISTPTHKGGTG